MSGRETTSTAIPAATNNETGVAISGRITTDKVNEAFSEYNKKQSEVAIQIFEALNDKFSKLEEEQKELKVEQLKQTEDLDKKVTELASESKDSAFRMIEFVGIFTALLGFIVFEAQIFKATQTTLTLVGLTSVMLGALAFFVLLLDLAFDGFKTNRDLRKALFGFSVICIISGFIAAYFGYKNGDYKTYLTKEEIVEEIDERIRESTNSATTTTLIQNQNNDLLEFKNCILKNGLSKCL